MAVFGFDGLEDKNVYNSGRVIIIMGNHQVFNNIMIDRLREMASGRGLLGAGDENNEVSLKEYNEQKKLMNETNEEFGLQEEEGTSRSGFGVSSLDMDTFFEVCSVPPVSGKWYCCVGIDAMSKKNREKFERYLKKPSQYGILVVTIADFKEKKRYKTMQAIKSNQYSHVVDLSYPRRSMLSELVNNEFNKYGKKVAEAGVSLFVIKMGDAYDKYSEAIEKIIGQNLDADVIDLEMIKFGLKGYDVVSVDDFISSLCRPMNSKKVVKNRYVYKELNALLRTFTARELVVKLRYKVNDMIQYRVHINNGNIPVMGRYNADKIKNRLPENCKIKKKPDSIFKREAYLSSKTSLEDWYYMKLILETPKGFDDLTYTRALLNLMNRQTLSNDRLMNVIGVKDTLSENLVGINGLFYTNWWRDLKRTVGTQEERGDNNGE